MSGKQAKRERQAIRASGKLPRVDAKRLVSRQAYQAVLDRATAAERFKLEQPRVYEQLQQARAARVRKSVDMLAMMVGLVGTL